MATIYNYEDLVVWQESRAIAKAVYQLCSNVKDPDFRSQIQRASVSIMNNIAEGFDRNKIDDTNKSFIYFLDVAYGSCGEVKSMSYLAEDIGFFSPDDAAELRRACYSISSKIYSLIQNLKNNPKPTNNKTTK